MKITIPLVVEVTYESFLPFAIEASKEAKVRELMIQTVKRVSTSALTNQSSFSEAGRLELRLKQVIEDEITVE